MPALFYLPGNTQIENFRFFGDTATNPLEHSLLIMETRRIKGFKNMNDVDVFLQGYGLSDIAVLSAKPDDTIEIVLSKLDQAEARDESLLVFVQDASCAVERNLLVEELLPLAADDKTLGPLCLHVSHCRKVENVIRFNGEEKQRLFPPSTTVERVRRWAARRAFKLSPRDAAGHVLQLQGTTTRPDRDMHVGTLTDGKTCAVVFDLVPSKRVEG